MSEKSPDFDDNYPTFESIHNSGYRSAALILLYNVMHKTRGGRLIDQPSQEDGPFEIELENVPLPIFPEDQKFDYTLWSSCNLKIYPEHTPYMDKNNTFCELQARIQL